MGIAAQLHDLGFRIVATRGTAAAIKRMGIPVETINKIQDGSPHVVDWIDRGDVDLVINTPTGTAARSDGYEIRRAASPAASLHHDDRGRDGGRAGDRRRARRASPPVVSLQELPHRERGARARRMSDRTLAPLGRRLAEVVEYRRVGAYDILVCDDPDGPEPDPGQFYMLAAAERWGGGADERPFLPRAFSVMRRVGAAAGVHARGGRARARRGWASCAPATGCGSRARSGSASPRRATAAAPLLVGGGVGTAPLASCRTRTGAEALARFP